MKDSYSQILINIKKVAVILLLALFVVSIKAGASFDHGFSGGSSYFGGSSSSGINGTGFFSTPNHISSGSSSNSNPSSSSGN